MRKTYHQCTWQPVLSWVLFAGRRKTNLKERKKDQSGTKKQVTHEGYTNFRDKGNVMKGKVKEKDKEKDKPKDFTQVMAEIKKARKKKKKHGTINNWLYCFCVAFYFDTQSKPAGAWHFRINGGAVEEDERITWQLREKWKIIRLKRSVFYVTIHYSGHIFIIVSVSYEFIDVKLLLRIMPVIRSSLAEPLNLFCFSDKQKHWNLLNCQKTNPKIPIQEHPSAQSTDGRFCLIRL